LEGFRNHAAKNWFPPWWCGITLIDDVPHSNRYSPVPLIPNRNVAICPGLIVGAAAPRPTD